MKNRILFLFLPLLAVCAGCASKKVAPVQTFEPVPPEVAGSAVPSGSIETVYNTGNVRVYQLGRRIDPQHPNIMHEAGQMYVLSDSGNWNLSPNYPPLDPRHNRSITIPAPLAAEKMLEIKTLQANNELMEKLGDALVKTHNELLKEKESAAKSAENYKQAEKELKAQLAALKAQSELQARKLVELQLMLERRNRQQSAPQPGIK